MASFSPKDMHKDFVPAFSDGQERKSVEISF